MKFLAEDVIIKSWSNLIDIGENNKASLNKFLGILELLQQLNITQNGSVKSNFEYQIVSNKLSNSLQEKYYFSSGTLKAFNSQEKLYVIFPENWINNIFEILLKSKKLPLEQLVILLFQNDSFPDDCTINDLIDLFFNKYHLLEAKDLFFSSSTFDIQLSDNKPNRVNVFNGLKEKFNITDDSKFTFGFEKNLIAANPGELARGPFIQPLYSGQENLKCLLLSNFSVLEYYNINTSVTTISVDFFNSILSSYYLSIKTKPFIILAGLSGTGKSRLVRALAYQFNNIDTDRSEKKSPSNFKLIKVKPNWHDSSDLLGYESRISGKDRYVVTEFMCFIADAWKHKDTPFFLCLDEMNLAPVEQYFAEYLSVIETREVKENREVVTDCLVSANIIKKYTGKKGQGVDENFDLWKELNITDEGLQKQMLTNGLCLPSNLIVIGTVNMDETTHSFSRKVLDRAMTIEMNDINLAEGLTNEGNAWDYPAESFSAQLVLSEKTHGFQVFSDLAETGQTVITYLEEVNTILEKSPFKIAYRVRDEFLLYAYNYNLIEDKPAIWVTEALDNMTLMKILPRIEGDDHKTHVLDALKELFESKGLRASLKKANEMIEKRNAYHYTSFWS